MHKLLRKTVVCLIVLLAAAALPVASFAVSGADFVDRFDPNGADNTAYWGYPYIDAAAKYGIIEGYEQGDGTRVFLPRNDVTKQEAITMIVNTVTRSSLGYSFRDCSADWTAVLTDAHIAEWAYPYVSFALENGFLTEEDAYSFMVPSGGGYAAAPASREEVIAWTGRALWKKYASFEGTVYSLSYTDSGDVSQTAAPYLALLTRLGVIQGSENGDGTYSFAPKRTITRVEFAVICNKVFDLPKTDVSGPSFYSYGGTLSGLSVRSDGTGSFRIGSAVIYSADPAHVIRNSTHVSGLGELKNGMSAVVSWGSDGQLHIDTRMVSLTGMIQSYRSEDANGYCQLTIRQADGTVAAYYLKQADPAVSVTGTVAASKTVAILADGVNIIELVIK